MLLKQTAETLYRKSRASLLIIAPLKSSPLEKMIYRDLEDVIVTYRHKIQRNKRHELLTKPFTKTFQIVYDKRQITKDYKTLPFGY